MSFIQPFPLSVELNPVPQSLLESEMASNIGKHKVHAAMTRIQVIDYPGVTLLPASSMQLYQVSSKTLVLTTVAAVGWIKV